MPDAITGLLADMASEILIAQPGAEDETGTFVASGAAISIANCRIGGGRKMVRDAKGREIVSSFRVTSLGLNSLTTEGFRYTLPSNRPEPRTNLKAIEIRVVPDENGPHHEVIEFP